MYYVKTAISGRWLVLENGHSHTQSVNDLIQLVPYFKLFVLDTGPSDTASFRYHEIFKSYSSIDN